MRRRLQRLIALALLVVAMVMPSGLVRAEGSGFGWRPEELNWYGISQRRINDTRADAGRALLPADDYLWGVAHERARDMLARNYLSHVTPEGLDAGAYMRKDGASYEAWTELRADDRSGASEEAVAWRVVDRFLNDPGARAAIVGEADRFAVAMAENGQRRVFVVLLAKAAAQPVVQSLTSASAPAAPRTVTEIILAAAARHGVDGPYLVRVARCESSLNPRAYNPAGPYVGLFQFLPATFYSYGGREIYSAEDQANVAARMIARGMASHWPVCGRR
jgi:hypothetical protein